MRYDGLISGIDAQIRDLQFRKKDLIDKMKEKERVGLGESRFGTSAQSRTQYGGHYFVPPTRVALWSYIRFLHYTPTIPGVSVSANAPVVLCVTSVCFSSSSSGGGSSSPVQTVNICIVFYRPPLLQHAGMKLQVMAKVVKHLEPLLVRAL